MDSVLMFALLALKACCGCSVWLLVVLGRFFVRKIMMYVTGFCCCYCWASDVAPVLNYRQDIISKIVCCFFISLCLIV